MKNFKYQVRRPYYKVKHFIQRGRRGWSDEDVWAADGYLAGIIADILEWYAGPNSHGVSMRYSNGLDQYNPDVDIMVKRRDEEYSQYAAIFREYSVNGDAFDEKWQKKYGGVLDKDMQEALQWFATIYTELWD